MAEYELEIIGSKGNRFRNVDGTLGDARHMAMRFAKGGEHVVMIYSKDGYRMKEVEKVYHNPDVDMFFVRRYAQKDTKRLSKSGAVIELGEYWRYA